MLKHQDIGRLSAILHEFKTRLGDAFSSRAISYPPMQIKVLRLVSERAPCTAQCVAQTLSRDKGQVTRLLQELVSDGILTREPNPDDKRSQLLSLSPEGEALFARMREAEQQVLADVSGQIAADDLQLFASVLQRFHEQMMTPEDAG